MPSDAIRNDVSDAIRNDVSDAIRNDVSDAIRNDVSDAIRNDVSDAIRNDVSDAILNDVSDAILNDDGYADGSFLPECDVTSPLMTWKQVVSVPPGHVYVAQVTAADSRWPLCASENVILEDELHHASSSEGSADSPNAGNKTSRRHMYEPVDRGCAYTDTICSNRSAYFKRYYLQSSTLPSPTSPKHVDPPQKPDAPATGIKGMVRRASVFVRNPEVTRKHVSSWAQQIHFSWVAMTLLFIVILSSIAIIVQQYQLHKSKYALFGRMKFNEAQRRLDILSSDERRKLIARLFIADLVPNPDESHDCGKFRSTRASHTSKYVAQSTSEGTGVCLEWKNEARLTLESVKGDRLNCSGSVCRDIQCFRVDWEALSETAPHLRDCFSLTQPIGQVWYGSSETASGSWIISDSMSATAMVTGDIRDHQMGALVQKYFISSNGVGVLALNKEPLFVSVDRERGRWCLTNPRQPFPYPAGRAGLRLAYYTCLGPDISHLYRFGASTQNPYKRHSWKAKETLWPSFQKIIFDFPKEQQLTQKDVLAFSDDIIEQAYEESSVVVIGPHWQKHLGDLEFDSDRFTNPWKMIEILQKRGIEIALTLNPVVELKSDNIEQGIDDEMWIRQDKSGNPGLINIRGIKGVYMDLSSPATRAWLTQKLIQLRNKTRIKSIIIDPIPSQNLPYYYNLTAKMPNPDWLSEPLVQAVRDAGIEVISISIACKPFKQPTFVGLSVRRPSWEELQKVVPSVLAAATGGTHLIIPSPVTGTAEDQELYIRWLQVAVFMPRVRFAVVPNRIQVEADRIARLMLWKRRQLVLPEYDSILQNMLTDGEPLVRPLWYHFGNDFEVFAITDQFMVGNSLMVAPVLMKSATYRRVYLPQGLWKEMNSGRIDRGNQWIEEPVTLETVPHYQPLQF